MKKKILSILLAVSMVSSSFTVLATENAAAETAVEAAAEDVGIEARDIHEGPYEKYQIVRVYNNDKLIMNVGDEPIIAEADSNVVYWEHDKNIGVAQVYKRQPGIPECNANYKATVTPQNAGKLKVPTKDFNKNAVMTFTVIVNDSVAIEADETMQLSAIMNGDITWASDEPTIAEVDATGMVKGISEGTAKITATDVDKDVVTFTVTVKGKPVQLNKGDTKDFSEFLPESGNTWTWSVKDSEIASVDSNGIVTGLKLGATDVIATNEKNESVVRTVYVTELQYFNTNIFDYKEGKKPTSKNGRQ